uniref:Uncharacterized protein n=1 Tax=Cannabis sativa TaxID=3483 RepID=A0A803QRV1_CANSA
SKCMFGIISSWTVSQGLVLVRVPGPISKFGLEIKNGIGSSSRPRFFVPNAVSMFGSEFKFGFGSSRGLGWDWSQLPIRDRSGVQVGVRSGSKFGVSRYLGLVLVRSQ